MDIVSQVSSHANSLVADCDEHDEDSMYLFFACAKSVHLFGQFFNSFGDKFILG